MTVIGVTAHYGRSGYIKAVRSGIGPDLDIAGANLWGVDHPVHGHASSGGWNSKKTRE